MPNSATDPAELPLAAEERAILCDVHASLYRALARGEVDRPVAIRAYLQAKGQIASRVGYFGIVNYRVFIAGSVLVVPYLVRDAVVAFVGDERDEPQVHFRRYPRGTIYSDGIVAELAGVKGEPIDLADDLYTLDIDKIGEVQVARVADMAELLQGVNTCVNRNEAVYRLRHLVARLCSQRDRVVAKNLQPEVAALTQQLVALFNGSLRHRVPWLLRMVTRYLADVIGQPGVIDRLWSDTIALAEVHVRGSGLVNELRRTCHHALGSRTLALALAYRDYLRDGDEVGMVALGFAAAASDEAARGRPEPLQLIDQVVADLGQLLGAHETVARVRAWQDAYTAALNRCDSGRSIDEELDAAIHQGIRAENRWTLAHHLDQLRKKLREYVFASALDARDRFDVITSVRPGDAEWGKGDFAPDVVEQRLREAIDVFKRALLQVHVGALFEQIGRVLASYEQGRYFEVMDELRHLRLLSSRATQRGGFPSKRFLLGQLDCLLEELGYLAARHLASGFEADGVDLDRCFAVIRLSALNLQLSGLASRELLDVTAMLDRQVETKAELENVLHHTERCYHRVRQRLTVPYERMGARLGFDEDALRKMLANMQRCMHDLNTIAHFSDIASAYLRDGPASDELAKGATAEPAAAAAILHLADRVRISELMQPAPDQPPDSQIRKVYGGKGSGLIYISSLNIPTRDAFILPTTLPRAGFHRRGGDAIVETVRPHIARLERDVERHCGVAKRIGDPESPLLVSVRGGSVFSMPGILSTVVFVGINDAIAEGLARIGPWRAYDSYRRFLASFAWAAWGEDLDGLRLVDEAKRRHGVRRKTELPWEALQQITERYKQALRDRGYGDALERLLDDPVSQVYQSIGTVYASWDSDTAARYRGIKGYCDSWQTAVIVQEMAFGNWSNADVAVGMDETCASLTGVIPRTRADERGVRQAEGEVKFSAAGDDLVGGIVGTESIMPLSELRRSMPMLVRRLRHIIAKLRRLMGTDQEIEFTVERGVLSVLQTRTAETAVAASVREFDEPGEADARGLGVCGGAFRGVVAFDDDDLPLAVQKAKTLGDEVDGALIIVQNPTPEDIPMILSADGLLTAKGGSTSHAAVAANGVEDRVFSAVMSASGLQVSGDEREAVLVDEAGEVRHRIVSGDVISIHGTSGAVFIGSRRIA